VRSRAVCAGSGLTRAWRRALQFRVIAMAPSMSSQPSQPELVAGWVIAGHENNGALQADLSQPSTQVVHELLATLPRYSSATASDRSAAPPVMPRKALHPPLAPSLPRRGP